MTVQEAKCQQCNKKCPQEKLASDIAKGRMYATNEFIQCQKELEQYRAIGTPTQILERIGGLDVELGKYACIGTVEELKEAREKQIPKKIKVCKTPNTSFGKARTYYVCPNCGAKMCCDWKFCFECGQALDWEEGGTSD